MKKIFRLFFLMILAAPMMLFSACSDSGEPVCAHSNKESFEIIAATWSEDGLTAGEKCSDCGEIVSGGEVIQKPIGLTFESKDFLFDGTEKQILISGELPEGVTVSYKNNKRLVLGSNVATAIFESENGYYNLSNLTAIIMVNDNLEAVPTNLSIENAVLTWTGSSEFGYKVVLNDQEYIVDEECFDCEFLAGIISDVKIATIFANGDVSGYAEINDFSIYSPVSYLRYSEDENIVTFDWDSKNYLYDFVFVKNGEKTYINKNYPKYEIDRNELLEGDVIGVYVAGNESSKCYSSKITKITLQQLEESEISINGYDIEWTDVYDGNIFVFNDSETSYSLSSNIFSFRDKPAGEYTISVKAIADNYLSSINTFSFTKNQTPNISINNGVVSWQNIAGQNKYFVDDGNNDYEVTTNMFELSNRELENDLFIISKAESENRMDSEKLIISNKVKDGFYTAYIGIYLNTNNVPYYYGVENISNLYIPVSMNKVNFESVKSDINLVSNFIPETLNNDYIKTLIIPEGTTSIEDEMFYNCSKLTAVTIPKTLTTITKRLFVGCDDLISIVIDEDNGVFDSRDNSNAIIKKSNNSIVEGCKGTIVPETIKIIEKDAFKGSKIESVLIPESIEDIKTGAFDSCLMLKNIFYAGSFEKWSEFVLTSESNPATLVEDMYYYAEEDTIVDISIDCKYWYDNLGEKVVWQPEIMHISNIVELLSNLLGNKTSIADYMGTSKFVVDQILGDEIFYTDTYCEFDNGEVKKYKSSFLDSETDMEVYEYFNGEIGYVHTDERNWKITRSSNNIFGFETSLGAGKDDSTEHIMNIPGYGYFFNCDQSIYAMLIALSNFAKNQRNQKIITETGFKVFIELDVREFYKYMLGGITDEELDADEEYLQEIENTKYLRFKVEFSNDELVYVCYETGILMSDVELVSIQSFEKLTSQITAPEWFDDIVLISDLESEIVEMFDEKDVNDIFDYFGSFDLSMEQYMGGVLYKDEFSYYNCSDNLPQKYYGYSNDDSIDPTNVYEYFDGTNLFVWDKIAGTYLKYTKQEDGSFVRNGTEQSIYVYGLWNIEQPEDGDDLTYTLMNISEFSNYSILMKENIQGGYKITIDLSKKEYLMKSGGEGDGLTESEIMNDPYYLNFIEKGTFLIEIVVIDGEIISLEFKMSISDENPEYYNNVIFEKISEFELPEWFDECQYA